MPNYNKNFLTSMTGHIDFNEPDPAFSTPSLSLRDTALLRDVLGNLVGSGVKNLSSHDAKSQYEHLVGKLGGDRARELMNYVFIYNQRPDTQGLSPIDKVRQFYQIKSSNEGIRSLLDSVNAFAQGPVAGLNYSSSLQNKKFVNKDVPNIGSYTNVEMPNILK